MPGQGESVVLVGYKSGEYSPGLYLTVQLEIRLQKSRKSCKGCAVPSTCIFFQTEIENWRTQFLCKLGCISGIGIQKNLGLFLAILMEFALTVASEFWNLPCWTTMFSFRSADWGRCETVRQAWIPFGEQHFLPNHKNSRKTEIEAAKSKDKHSILSPCFPERKAFVMRDVNETCRCAVMFCFNSVTWARSFADFSKNHQVTRQNLVHIMVAV